MMELAHLTLERYLGHCSRIETQLSNGDSMVALLTAAKDTPIVGEIFGEIMEMLGSREQGGEGLLRIANRDLVAFLALRELERDERLKALKVTLNAMRFTN